MACWHFSIRHACSDLLYVILREVDEGPTSSVLVGKCKSILKIIMSQGASFFDITSNTTQRSFLKSSCDVELVHMVNACAVWSLDVSCTSFHHRLSNLICKLKTLISLS